jgi:alpha-1,6-mannosyltransferase
MKKTGALRWRDTLCLLGLGSGLSAIFLGIGQQRNLKAHVPEFIALMLLAGIVYLAGTYAVENFSLGGAAIAVILGAGILARWAVLPARPSLSEDVYRYQWDGRVERAGINPYAVYPGMRRLARFQNPEHPIQTGRFIPTIYPPLSEWLFARLGTVGGLKRTFTALDLATLGVILLLLGAMKQPLHRALIYAWNPAVIASFALSGHHDSLAVFTLVVSLYFTIVGQGAFSIIFLAFSFLSKLFSAILLPVFLKRTRWAYAGIFVGLAGLAYFPFRNAGWRLGRGLSDYAAAWEGNDSLFRLLRLAGNSKPQAELIAVTLAVGLVVYALKRRLEPASACLVILAGLLFLSPNAFPWYFTWFVPFLCLEPSPPLLLMTVTCVLGYSPVAAYAAGSAYRNSPLMLGLEYLPVYVWLAALGIKKIREADWAGTGRYNAAP